jgi:hypothetical protein
MARHIPGVVWSLRGFEYGAYVRTNDDRSLYVSVMETGAVNPTGFFIDRKDARLLAKRLNACLDDTRGSDRG